MPEDQLPFSFETAPKGALSALSALSLRLAALYERLQELEKDLASTKSYVARITKEIYEVNNILASRIEVDEKRSVDCFTNQKDIYGQGKESGSEGREIRESQGEQSQGQKEG